MCVYSSRDNSRDTGSIESIDNSRDTTELGIGILTV
jgi:hypothetical protein